MAELPDYELRRSDNPGSGDDIPGPPPPPPPSRGRRWMALGLLAGVVVLAALLFMLRRDTDDTAVLTEPEPVAAPAAATEPETPVEPIDLPPLDESDPVVRQLVSTLSSHPRLAAWLATGGLVRRFVAIVENIDQGVSPAVHTRPLRTAVPFEVREEGDTITLDARSFARYADVAAIARSLDPEGTATLIRQIEPRLDEAYADLGHTGPFRDALERALIVLLQTPEVRGEIRLRPQGAYGYRFADPALEALPPAQKQLLRMGPANREAITGALRAIARALDVPEARLPPRG
ncbi:MAG: DUF3014 domain-containing protein [Vicinamibacterales bacterium]